MYIIVAIYCGNFLFMEGLSCYLFGAMGFGDGIAPLVGATMPIGKYRSFDGAPKTLSGSLTMFLGTICGVYIFQAALGVPETLEFAKVAVVALVATIVEGASGIFFAR